MTPDAPLDPPASAASSRLADWLETLLLIRGDEEISREQVKRLLSGEPLESPGGEAEVEEADVERLTKFDVRVDSLLREIERRREIAPRIYPFRVDEQLVVREEVAGQIAYLFLLWLSLPKAPFRNGRLDEVEEPFDDISRAALVVLAGPDGEAKLFAQRYAVDPPTDHLRPTGFPEAIAWLRGHLKLSAGHGSAVAPSQTDEEEDPDESEDQDDQDDQADLPLRTYNDGGVDVVAWRHFCDGRVGFPVLLAQCTVQEKWRPKTRDISISLWRSWIDFPTPPQKMLLIPFAIPEGAAGGAIETGSPG